MLTERINSDFNQYAAKAGQDLFFETRKKAFEAFEKLGFPTAKNEEWRYTSLKGITGGNFENN